MAAKTLPKTSSELLEAYLRHLRVDRGLSPRTLINYRIDIERYLSELASSEKDPLLATREDLTDYLWSRKAKGGVPSSLARYIASLRTFYRFLAAEEMIKTDPSAYLEGPRKPERLPRYLTVNEVSRLMTSSGGANPRALRLKAILELMYAAGLRVSELCGLRLDGIDLKIGYVRVLGKGGKERVIPIGESAKMAAHAYLDHRPATPASVKTFFVSDRKRTLSTVQCWRLIRQAALKAGIVKPVTPHTLRHSFASHLVQHGADLRAVQEMLGHSSITTTQIYTHVGQSHLQDAHRKYHPRG